MTLVHRSLPAIREAAVGAQAMVPHLDLDAVQELIAAASRCRNGGRDAL